MTEKTKEEVNAFQADYRKVCEKHGMYLQGAYPMDEGVEVVPITDRDKWDDYYGNFVYERGPRIL